MQKRLFLINFKCYKEATGKNALKLAKIIDSLVSRSQVNIAVAVQPTDIYQISKECKHLKVFSQHIDPIKEGAHTGAILASAIKSAGALGTLLNHSEKKLKFEVLEKCIKIAKENKLSTIVFCKDLTEVNLVSSLKPDYIALEPPELISGKISVSQAKPDLIKEVSSIIKNKLLVGAGVHSKEDVETALKLGANGIAVSSAVVRSKNPRKELLELIKSFKI